MNFLAHAYLSFNDESILVGNMTSDFVKGNKRFDYPTDIQKGITLHRLIDTYTDQHAATKQARNILKHAVGLYAAPFVDIVYDHFLANDENEFTDKKLQQFAVTIYEVLQKHQSLLPERFQNMLPYMREQNWLYNYGSLYGAERSFSGLARRSKYLQTSATAFESFISNYEELNHCYFSFFPDVKNFAFESFLQLTQT